KTHSPGRRPGGAAWIEGAGGRRRNNRRDRSWPREGGPKAQARRAGLVVVGTPPRDSDRLRGSRTAPRGAGATGAKGRSDRTRLGTRLCSFRCEGSTTRRRSLFRPGRGRLCVPPCAGSGGGVMRLHLKPIPMRIANDYVEKHHSHHGRVRGCKYSI